MRLLLVLCLCASCGPPPKERANIKGDAYSVDEANVTRLILPDGHHYIFVRFGDDKFAYGGMDHCHDCPKCKLGGIE